MKRIASLLICLAIVSLTSISHADILIFEGFGDPDNRPLIPQDYGDRITQLNDPVTGYIYGAGNGPTPNVTVDYIFDDPNDGDFTLWNGYGDLNGALGHFNFNVEGEIALNADAGFNVVLNTFDIAPFQIDRDGIVRVLDGDDNVLFDTGVLTFDSTSRWSYGGSALIASTLRIQSFLPDGTTGGWGDFALDNVNFDQRAVPEPSTITLLSLFATGIVAFRRRRSGT